jgi:hypothetical protein
MAATTTMLRQFDAAPKPPRVWQGAALFIRKRSSRPPARSSSALLSSMSKAQLNKQGRSKVSDHVATLIGQPQVLPYNSKEIGRPLTLSGGLTAPSGRLSGVISGSV